MKQQRFNHTVYCSAIFKSRVEKICIATDMSPADLVKAVFLFSHNTDYEKVLLEDDSIEREKTVVKTGKNAGKIMLRKPRLQVILPYKLSPKIIKKALTVAVKNNHSVNVCNDVIMEIVSGIQPDMVEVKTVRDAMHILGYAPRTQVEKVNIKKRYRTLLKEYHSDTGKQFVDSERLEAVQQAWKIIDSSMD